MKATKILSLILALIMLCSVCLAACSKDGGGQGGGVDVVKKTEDDDDSAVYDSEIHDMHGHKFWFLVRDAAAHPHLDTNEIYAEGQNGDKINDAVFKRNAILQEKYKCEIFEERNDSPATAVREQLIAGEYQYDYIYTGVNTLRTLSASNLLVDYYEIESINLEKAWWDQNAIQGLSIGGKAFYVTGDAGTLDDRASWIMYFNKDIIERAHLQNPYELVSAGSWTVDKMYEYMLATIDDKNGDGVWTVGTDVFGYIGEGINNWYHVAACGAHLSRMSSGGEIDIPATVNDDVLAAWAAVKPVLTSPYRDVSDSGSRFRNGLGTFFGCNTGAILNIGASTVNFGVVPMPKMNEEQEEYWTSIHSSWTYGFSIPVAVDNASDYEQNGFTSGREQAAYFLEAFSYHSMDTLTVAFYDQVLKRQVVKDLESAEMIDLALKNKLYDPVVLFNFGKIGNTLFIQTGSNGTSGTGGTMVGAVGSDANYDTLVSVYESRVAAARKALTSYLLYIQADD